METHDTLNELREVINSSISCKQRVWDRKGTGDWNKLWSAFDAIEDTQLAIDEFESSNKGYLAIFGALQALIVQQDAIKHLSEAANITPWTFKEYPELERIRNIRIETIGHPTKTGKKGDYINGEISFTSLSRESKDGILVYGVWSKGGFKSKQEDVKAIIHTQRLLIQKEISKVIAKISEDEQRHMDKFKNQSSSEILKSTDYLIQKLWPFEKDRLYSRICFDSLKKIYEKFKNDIKARFNFEQLNESIQIPGLIFEMEKVDKLIPRLEKMIPMVDVDELDLEVYIESLSHCFEMLRKMAEETDERFNSIPSVA